MLRIVAQQINNDNRDNIPANCLIGGDEEGFKRLCAHINQERKKKGHKVNLTVSEAVAWLVKQAIKKMPAEPTSAPAQSPAPAQSESGSEG